MNSHQDSLTEPQSRLEAFIARGRESIQAINGINFADDVWELPHDRAGTLYDKRLNFSVFQGAFKDLLKAIVANVSAAKDGRGQLARGAIITAARHLAPVVANLPRMSGIGLDHFHRAIRSIRDRRPEYQASTKFTLAFTLTLLAKELDANRLTPCFLQFRNPFQQLDSKVRCDEESRIKLRKKLPKPGALTALGEIYHEVMHASGTPQDRLLVCAAVLLCCTGFRINELLALPVNCWHEGKTRDEEGRTLPACFLGYAPEKSGTDNAMNRWIAPAMVELAKEALDEVRRITEPFRENARIRFLGEVNLPLEEGRTYNATEAAEILGFTKYGFRNLLLRERLFQPTKATNGHYRITAQDLRDLVISRCFEGPIQTFPWRQELHESLFVVSYAFFQNETGMNGTTNVVDDLMVRRFLVGCSLRKSCFEQFGKFDPETGKPWRIPTHAFRHMLNTLFQLGGFTQDDIASYFGRKDARANENYNHMTGRQRMAIATAAYENGELVGPLREALDGIKDPIRRKQAMIASFGNTQLSPLGICFHHDGAEIPSIPDRCAVCPGLAIIKGHPSLIEETQRQLEMAERTYTTLQDGLAKGYLQDGPWVPLAAERLDRLRMMLKMHLDHSIPDNRVIQLGNPKRKRELCTPTSI